MAETKTKRRKREPCCTDVRIGIRRVNGVEIDEETFFNTVWTNENLIAIFRMQDAIDMEE